MSSPLAFDSITITGRFDVSIRLGPDLENSITYPDGINSHEPVVRLTNGSFSIECSEDLEVPIRVDISSATVKRVGAFRRAQVQMSGSAQSLAFVAYRQATIDASELTLATAEVDLETSSDVIIAATKSVTGSVAYGARLKLAVEPEHTKIVTGNAGKVLP